jgi:hypothetical protein
MLFPLFPDFCNALRNPTAGWRTRVRPDVNVEQKSPRGLELDRQGRTIIDQWEFFFLECWKDREKRQMRSRWCSPRTGGSVGSHAHESIGDLLRDD